MRELVPNRKLIWTFLFFLLLLTEFLDVAVTFFFPSVQFFKFIALGILIGTMPFFVCSMKKWNEQLQDYQESKENLKNIFNTLDVAIWSHNLKLDSLLTTPGIEKLYGYSSEEFSRDPLLWKKAVHPDDLSVLAEREKKINLGEIVTSEYRIIRRDGNVRWILDRGFPTFDQKGKLVYFTSVLFDINDQKESEDRYRSLVEMSPDIIMVVKKEKIEYINESGWKLLGASNREEILGQSPMKFAPREIFTMIQHELGVRHSAKNLRLEFPLKKLNGDLIEVEITAAPIQYGGKFSVQVVGRDISERKKAENLIKTMAYYDTLTGLPNRNKFRQYLNGLNGISVRKMELENGLRKALEKNQLTLFYQPQVSLTTGQVVGAEALIRWHHPERGFIPPSEFIPLAEETGLILPIGKWVLKEACHQKKAWEQQGLAGFPIAVNVSARQLEDDQFVNDLANVLDETGLEPNHLELEITESIMQNLEFSSKLLNRLKNMGVSLAIDDFGTGYSSLSYLKYLPIDKLKIDKSFVDDIDHASDQGTMVKTIIDMGKNLKFTVIAEGIETKEQLSFLQQNNCHIGQGYLFSKPLPREQLEEFLLKGKLYSC